MISLIFIAQFTQLGCHVTFGIALENEADKAKVSIYSFPIFREFNMVAAITSTYFLFSSLSFRMQNDLLRSRQSRRTFIGILPSEMPQLVTATVYVDLV